MKPIVIEAFQMTKESFNDNTRWPQWLHEAWTGDILLFDPNHTECNWKDMPLVLYVRRGPPLPIEWGDWIIKGLLDGLCLCSADAFENICE